jgi:hypothetical protein
MKWRKKYTFKKLKIGDMVVDGTVVPIYETGPIPQRKAIPSKRIDTPKAPLPWRKSKT